MTISMYQASVPVFIRMLNNLSELMNKGEAYAKEKEFEPEVLLNSRLAPDMLPLSRQIQIASDAAKGCAARLAGIDPPAYEDNEKNFAEIYERINKTITFLNTIKSEQIDGSEENTITLELPTATLNFKGMQFLLHFSLPHFYFHVTTAHDILRHNGVDIGKRDFLGEPD